LWCVEDIIHPKISAQVWIDCYKDISTCIVYYIICLSLTFCTYSYTSPQVDHNSTHENTIIGLTNLVVPFVACGDLSGFDPDKSYPLQMENETEEYQYRDPVQPPIHPNYHSYQQKFGKVTVDI
jgi:hypothetical protein